VWVSHNGTHEHRLQEIKDSATNGTSTGLYMLKCFVFKAMCLLKQNLSCNWQQGLQYSKQQPLRISSFELRI